MSVPHVGGAPTGHRLKQLRRAGYSHTGAVRRAGGGHRAGHLPAALYAGSHGCKVRKKLGTGRKPATHHKSMTGPPHFPRFAE